MSWLLWLIPLAIVFGGMGTFVGAYWLASRYDQWLTRRAQRRAGWWT